ncbi:hypothetical protein D5086_018027 [Populus alba]|uniref:Uncharacterized protein n=1 Tax=Populus alba TaxID=43335 RepID=A0ACC4BPX3_POPAL
MITRLRNDMMILEMVGCSDDLVLLESPPSIWSLGTLTGLSEILRQGTGCVKERAGPAQMNGPGSASKKRRADLGPNDIGPISARETNVGRSRPEKLLRSGPRPAQTCKAWASIGLASRPRPSGGRINFLPPPPACRMHAGGKPAEDTKMGGRNVPGVEEGQNGWETMVSAPSITQRLVGSFGGGGARRETRENFRKFLPSVLLNGERKKMNSVVQNDTVLRSSEFLHGNPSEIPSGDLL